MQRLFVQQHARNGSSSGSERQQHTSVEHILTMVVVTPCFKKLLELLLISLLFATRGLCHILATSPLQRCSVAVACPMPLTSGVLRMVSTKLPLSAIGVHKKLCAAAGHLHLCSCSLGREVQVARTNV
eukprot:631041-Amphidinium_carterae.1